METINGASAMPLAPERTVLAWAVLASYLAIASRRIAIPATDNPVHAESPMPNWTLRRAFALFLMAVTTACAAAAAAPNGPLPTNRSVITDAEIPTTGTESALELIRRLRPEYLRAKPTQTYVGATSNEAPPPSVFLNGQQIGDVGELRQIPAPSLSSVRYYNIEEGKRKFGMQYGGGVIEIRYRLP